MKNGKTIVLTYGTFDFLHIGHINLLKRAKEQGDFLIVGLSTDKFNTKKHKQSFSSFKDRKKILESIKYVDLVIPEKKWSQKRKDIGIYEVDKFVMGGDWHGKFDFLKDACEVIYLDRTENVSSTKFKKMLSSQR